MAVRHVAYTLISGSFLWRAPIQGGQDSRKRILFAFFILQRHNVFLLWVYTNKSSTVLNDVLLLYVWPKIEYFKLFPLLSEKKYFSFHTPHKHLDMHLIIAHIYLG